MLGPELRESLILIGFAILLKDYLTSISLLITVMGGISSIFHYRPNKWIRNISALLLLASYWFTYGRMIDPEVGLNFLTSVIVIKMLEKENQRDQYMIFLGLVLLISAGSLFEKTLTYTIFFIVSFFTLISNFYIRLGIKFKLKDFALLFAWILPLSFGLFFIFPRLMGPVPFGQANKDQGQVGYTPNVELSTFSSVISNDTPVFQALVDRRIKQQDLYWRGNTISQTDGWDWNYTGIDRNDSHVISEVIIANGGVYQQIRMFTKEDFLFSLDSPSQARIKNQYFTLAPPFTLFQRRSHFTQRYEVWTQMGSRASSEDDLKTYLRSGIPPQEKKWIQEKFKSKTGKELSEEIKNYFNLNQFSYSLSPGVIPSFKVFMKDKKNGFCSHYASAVALILRVKKIPTRLVSGYLGGEFNKFGGFYLVSQNDAHVWLEYYEKGLWTKLDPTQWIAPQRIEFGSEEFLRMMNKSISSGFNLNAIPYVKEARHWFAQWDFRFYQFIEEVDYYAQEAYLQRLNFRRQWLYLLAPILISLFLLFYLWQFNFRLRKKNFSEEERIWILFFRKVSRLTNDFNKNSLNEMKLTLQLLDDPKKNDLILILHLLEVHSFQGQGNLQEISLKLKKI